MKLVRPITITDSVYSSSNVPENDHAEYNAGTTYAAEDRVIDLTAHKIYESVQDSNTGESLTDTAWWVEVGYTNKWKPFDEKVSDLCTNPGSIDITLVVTEPLSSISFFGLAADQLSITMVADGLEVFSYDESLSDESSVASLFDYFFEPIVKFSDIEIPLPPYFGSVQLTISISVNSGNASVGEIVPGLARDLGELVFGTSIGIIDYSQKDRDDFGNALIVERDYSFRVDFDIRVETGFVDALKRLLASYRTTAIVWVGSSTEYSYGALVFGFYVDFDIVLGSEKFSKGAIQVESKI